MVTRPARTHCAGPSTTDCQPNYPRYPIHAHPVPDTRPTGTKNRTRSSGADDAIEDVQKVGFDPATDPHRQKVALPYGEMHLLPSALDGAVGVKVLGIQPAGSELDVPLVQGAYLLMGGETLTPEVVMDAAALTEIRTPAVAVAGVLDRLRESSEPL